MGLRRMELTLVLVVVGTLCGESMAQSGCTTAIISLSPCLNYITGNSSSPATSCCSQLSSVVRTQPQCLCTVLSGGGSGLGISINQTQALALPGACNVKTPPVSRCNSAGAPTTSPENTPAGTPAVPTSPSTPAGTPVVPTTPSTPSVPSTPAGSGSNTIPSLGGSSDGSLTKLPLPVLLILLIVASSTSALNYF